MNIRGLRKRVISAAAVMMLSVAGVAGVAQPASAGPAVLPGEVIAGMLYYRATFTLSGSATTNGWSKGTIAIHGYLYQPNGTLDRRYDNECANSTWCSLATWSFCPAIPGTWLYSVVATGPGGTARDSASAVVF